MDRTGDSLSLTADERRALRRNAASGAPDQPAQRAQNLAHIMRELYTDGPLSRPQLARRLGVSVPTATVLVADLLASGTVRDLGVVAEARVGKPAAKVTINAAGNVSVVLDLTQRFFVAAAVDLDGVVVDRFTSSEPAATGQAAIDQVLELAATIVERSAARVIGIGVASPGIVDAEGRVHVADRLGWRDVPIADLVQRRTGVVTIAHNDLTLLAAGERIARAEPSRDVIVVAIDNGVGAAVVLDGQPVRGEQSAAGEIGHIVVDPTGPSCVCGGRGCLDVLVGAPLLTRRVASEGPHVLGDAGALLGGALAPVVSMLNVNVVDVLGPAELVTGEFAAGVREGLTSRLRAAVADGLEIQVVPDDPDFVVFGAAAAVRADVLGVR